MANQPPKKPRVKIPQARVDEVMVQSHWTCCVCRRHNDVQVHHLNEDRTANDFGNLVAICPNCHSEAHGTAGFTRRRSSEQIRKSRDEWYEIVRRRREAGRPLQERGDSLAFETVLDAVAVVRIREIGHRRYRDCNLEELRAFLHGYGPRVAIEAMDVLEDAARLRRRDAQQSDRISALVYSFMPIYTLVGPSFRRLEEDERDVLRSAQRIGSQIAYQAARRSHDLKVLDAGGRILWSLLRYGVLNEREAELRDSCAAEFQDLERWCHDTGFADGERWVKFLAEDAVQWPDFGGECPTDVEMKIQAD